MPDVPRSEPLDLARDEVVLRELLRRRDCGSRDDGLKIALVIGGGGMRGAYSGGMTHALEDAGLADSFDAIYGSSAGAYIGAGLLLGQGQGSAHIFFEDMADPAFIDLRRLRSRRPVVSLDHLLDVILVENKPLPWATLRDHPIPLHVVATAADDLTGHVLQPKTIDEWKLTMRATSNIPFLAGKPVVLHGRKWIDGAVSEPLPLARALDDGATHVLVLVNRTPEDLAQAPSNPRPSRWAQAADRLVRGLGAMADERRRMGPAIALLRDADHPGRHGAQVCTVWPTVDAGIKGLTTHKPRVRQAAQAGYDSMVAAMSGVH
ncbi:MAG: patatin family protein [Nakamurella sp.]